MGQSTILQSVQQVAGELGLPATSSVLAATDATTQQLAALAVRCGQELYRFGPWATLDTELLITVSPLVTLSGTFTVGSNIIAGITGGSMPTGQPALFSIACPAATRTSRVYQFNPLLPSIIMTEPATQSGVFAFTIAQDTYAVPPDYAALIPRTAWDRSRLWELEGPLSPQEDQWLQSGVVAQGPRRKYRMVGRDNYKIVIRPAPTTTDLFPATLVFEYISAWWITDGVTGAAKPSFTADTDYVVFDDDVFQLGIQWMFMQRKGMAYQELKQDWMGNVALSFAAANPGRTLSAVGRTFAQYVGPANVPDGNYPGPVSG